MSSRYIGGIVTKNPTALNPALGNAANGIFTMDQYVQQKAAGTWPSYDPYSKYTTLLLHGDGTNGGQNNTFLDSSTNNFTITRNGNTTQGTFTPYGSNWSNYFDGASSLLPASNAAFNFGTGDFTVEAWVYQPASGVQCVYDSRGSDASSAGFFFGTISTNFVIYTGGTTVISTPMPLNSWNHFAIVRSGSTWTLYKNGVSSGTYSSAANLTDANRQIGASTTVTSSSANYLTGYISNLRVVKGTAVYTGAFTPSTTPLTAVSGTSLLTCQSNRFIDNSSNNFTLTVNGSPSVQRFSPFAPSAAYSSATIGGSGYFDGSGDYLTIPDNAAWNMGSGDFTAEAWVYPTSFANEAMIMGQWSGDTGSTTLNWALMFSSGSTGYLRLITSSNGSSVLFDLSTSTFALTLNMWQHIAAVRSGSTFTIYVNGVSRATTTNASALYDATNNFTIGAESNTQSQYFAGYISNARVVKGTAVYTAAFTPPTSPVTAVSGTSLLFDCTNGSIFDNAMMNDLETVGNAQISTSVKKYGAGSISIPGGGANAYIPPSPIFDMGTGDFTVECWVNNSSIAAAYPTFISSVTGWSAGASGHRFNNSGAANKFTFHLNGAGDPFLTSANTFSFGVWYHYALTRSGNTWRMFINGNQEASGTYTAAFNQALGGMRLGYSQWDGANGYYNGYIDDLRITKGYARYTANFTPPTSQLQDQGCLDFSRTPQRHSPR